MKHFKLKAVQTKLALKLLIHKNVIENFSDIYLDKTNFEKKKTFNRKFLFSVCEENYFYLFLMLYFFIVRF